MPLAMERAVHGRVVGTTSWVAQHSAWLKEGRLAHIIQIGPKDKKNFPDVPALREWLRPATTEAAGAAGSRPDRRMDVDDGPGCPQGKGCRHSQGVCGHDERSRIHKHDGKEGRADVDPMANELTAFVENVLSTPADLSRRPSPSLRSNNAVALRGCSAYSRLLSNHPRVVFSPAGRRVLPRQGAQPDRRLSASRRERHLCARGGTPYRKVHTGQTNDRCQAYARCRQPRRHQPHLQRGTKDGTVLGLVAPGIPLEGVLGGASVKLSRRSSTGSVVLRPRRASSLS